MGKIFLFNGRIVKNYFLCFFKRNPNDANIEKLPNWSAFRLNSPQVLKIDSDEPELVSMEVYFEKKNFWYNELLNGVFHKCVSDKGLKSLGIKNSIVKIHILFYFLVFLSQNKAY
jgi:hypothetical protein